MDKSSTLEAVLAEVYRSSDVRVSRVQSSCRADSGDRFDAALSDDVGLHLEFGRRFFLFTVQRNATNEVSAESARDRVRTVTEVLISSAEEQRLPPCTGPGGGQTATDRLLSTFAAMAWDSRSTYATVEAQKKKKKPTDRIFLRDVIRT